MYRGLAFSRSIGKEENSGFDGTAEQRCQARKTGQRGHEGVMWEQRGDESGSSQHLFHDMLERVGCKSSQYSAQISTAAKAGVRDMLLWRRVHGTSFTNANGKHWAGLVSSRVESQVVRRGNC